MVEGSGGLVLVDHRVETFAGVNGAGVAVFVDVLEGADGGLGVRGFSVPAHGSLSLQAASGGRQGVFRYQPQAGFTGLDYFRYWPGDGSEGWVEVRVWAVNGAPVAVGDLVLVEGDGPVTFSVLANDRDPDGNALRITGYSMPAKGQLALNADQSVTFTPVPGFAHHDSFTYSIRDVRTQGDGQVGVAEAQVTLLRPVVVPLPNNSPMVLGERVTATRDMPLSIDILANDVDSDGDSLRIAGLTVPLHGSVVLDADQTVTYTPAPGFTGIDDFTYIADDGRGGRSTGIVNIEVTVSLEVGARWGWLP